MLARGWVAAFHRLWHERVRAAEEELGAAAPVAAAAHPAAGVVPENDFQLILTNRMGRGLKFMSDPNLNFKLRSTLLLMQDRFHGEG